MGVVLDVISWTLLLSGSFFVLVGGVGLLRLPDFYTRIHAAGVTDTMGAWLILLGLMFQTTSVLILFKLVLVLVFLLLTSPLSGHLLAKAAYLRGLEPLLTETGASPAATDQTDQKEGAREEDGHR